MNRRLMMEQQNKGFELVYDAASGLLPTECGWKIIRNDNNTTLKVVNGILNVLGTMLYLSPDTEQSFTDCSIEIEYSVANIQSVTLSLNKVEPTIALAMSSWDENGIRVCQDWNKPFFKTTGVKFNLNHTAKLEKHGNLVLAFFNDEFIYSGEHIGSYASYLNDYVNLNPNNHSTPIYVKKMIYRGY